MGPDKNKIICVCGCLLLNSSFAPDKHDWQPSLGRGASLHRKPENGRQWYWASHWNRNSGFLASRNWKWREIFHKNSASIAPWKKTKRVAQLFGGGWHSTLSVLRLYPSIRRWAFSPSLPSVLCFFDNVFNSIVNHDDYFWQKSNCARENGIAARAKIATALDIMVHDVPLYAVYEYLVMPETTARVTVKWFCVAVVETLGRTYLRDQSKIFCECWEMCRGVGLRGFLEHRFIKMGVEELCERLAWTVQGEIEEEYSDVGCYIRPLTMNLGCFSRHA